MCPREKSSTCGFKPSMGYRTSSGLPAVPLALPLATLRPPNPLELEQKEEPNAASLSSSRSYFLGPKAGMRP